MIDIFGAWLTFLGMFRYDTGKRIYREKWRTVPKHQFKALRQTEKQTAERCRNAFVGPYQDRKRVGRQKYKARCQK